MEGFRRFTVSSTNPEDDLYELHERGALGTELIDQTSFRCFFPLESGVAEDAHRYCVAQGWRCSPIEQCKGENWVQACEEVWQPLQVGRFNIHPIIDGGSVVRNSADTIFIVPGEGFGTGHHPSTRLAMQLVQDLEHQKVHCALDFGTGNGILAITTAKVFPACPVTAIDNDASAIPNAAENLQLNGMTGRVTLSVDSLENLSGVYDLITANIYAEVLCSHSGNMYDRLAPGGYVILAGIMESRAPMIQESFTTERWNQIRHLTETGWEGFLFQKNR